MVRRDQFLNASIVMQLNRNNSSSIGPQAAYMQHLHAAACMKSQHFE